MTKNIIKTEVLVLGAGPGGYTAAFRSADLGKKVTLVERFPTLGGVCLNVGCIPSKALLHLAKVITDSKEAQDIGISYNPPQIDLDKIRHWKEKNVVGKLTEGLAHIAKQRNIQILQGTGKFTSAHQIEVLGSQGETKTIEFDFAIISAGSRPRLLPNIPQDVRIMNSTGALKLQDIPQRLLIIGGGIIGLEMGTVYSALGSKVTVAEYSPHLMHGCDEDLVKPLHKRLNEHWERILLSTKITQINAETEGIYVQFENEKIKQETQVYDRVLLAVGREPNGHQIGAENAGVFIDEQGFIPVNQQLQTNIPHIFAIGDIIGQPMLAHKATHEGKISAEIIAGEKTVFDAKVIPSVAYTDPEVAWVGITEQMAEQRNIPIKKASFPWMASGRALSMARTDGVTKLIFDKESDRLIGGGITGQNAGELISELVLAIEMGATAEDIALSIHPHPTLSETIALSAEMSLGTITDLYIKKRK